jgi:hypothetical protein
MMDASLYKILSRHCAKQIYVYYINNIKYKK